MESLWALCCKSLVKVTKLVLVSVGWVVYNENDTVSLASKSTCQKSLDVATGDVKAAAEAGADDCHSDPDSSRIRVPCGVVR